MSILENAEYITARFYQWECRGRGWLLGDVPIDLEPPFIPFVREIPRYQQYIDDGKHHTLLSKTIELIKGKPAKPNVDEYFDFDYSDIEPFIYDDDSNLVALQLTFPKERHIVIDNMRALLIMLSYTQHPISFEIIGNHTEIVIQFVCREVDTNLVYANIKSFFPQCSISKQDKYLDHILLGSKSTYVTDFGLQQEFVRPLPVSKNFNFDSLTAFFGALEHLKEGTQAGLQILFKSAINPWSESITHSVTVSDGTSFFVDAPESPELALEKIKSPLFAVTIRTFGQGDTQDESGEAIQVVSYPLLQTSQGAYNSLIHLPNLEYDIHTRIDDVYKRESHRLGMLLNVDELIHLLHFPTEAIQSKKLFASTRKTRATPAIATGKAYSLGTNPHNNTDVRVTTGIDERLKHTHIIGATGTGKSTLIANLILQDIEKGLGLALIDPHGDLVQDVMARIPESRLHDVVLIDPSDVDYPIGLNILQAHNDIEKEILSSDLVASFRKLSTSWGDQMNAVFGNAILAMLESNEGGTLHDVRRFLIEKDYREKFLKTVRDPSVLYYWLKEFPILKSNSVGPILTRLDTFLRPRTIRNMIVQKTGLNFEQLLNSNKIVLIKLSQGLIGTENSYLFGSIILSKIHQAAFARQASEQRNPFFIYIDEFQNIITPSIKEMLSGVRKYNVGLVLSHQDLQQLQRDDGELLNSVLGNSYTRVVFRVGEPDAKKLENSFTNFDANDMQNLSRGEAIVRIEQPQYDCSVNTVLPAVVDADTKENQTQNIINLSRTKYASTRAKVEEELFESLSLQLQPQDKVKKPSVEEAPTVIIKPEEPVRLPQHEKEVSPIQPQLIAEEPGINLSEEPEATSTHIYLQALVKRMAEAKGYTATIEAQTPTGDGKVDVLLTKESKTIAVEICVTTEADWEMHNIVKCINAGYDTIVSLSGDLKQLEKIKTKCRTGITDFEAKDIKFFTPDVFFQYLESQHLGEVATESTIKGYRVNVTYDAVTQEEMKRKRASVTQVVMSSLKRKKK